MRKGFFVSENNGDRNSKTLSHQRLAGASLYLALVGGATALSTPSLLPVGITIGVLGFAGLIFTSRRINTLLHEKTEAISALLERTSEGIFKVDHELRITYANRASETLLRFASEKLIGKTLWELYPPLAGSSIEEAFRTAISTASYTECEYHSTVGEWYSVRVFPEHNGLTVHLTNTSAIKRVIRAEQEHLRMLEHALEGFAKIDSDGKYIEVNPAYAQQIGLEVSQIKGARLDSHVFFDDLDTLGVAIAEMREQGKSDCECRLSNARFETCWYHVSLVKYDATTHSPAGFYVFTKDITAQKEYESEMETQIALTNEAQLMLQIRQLELESANEQLTALAITDGLTGTNNHRAFQEFMDELIHTNTPFSLVLMDVDQFKMYNDSYGHPAGDAVLRQVATIVKEKIRATDFLARYGGEEFAIVLPKMPAQNCVEFVNRIRTALETADWPNRVVTASFGCTTYRPDATKAELISEADNALYKSKREGRNRVTHIDFPDSVTA